MKQVKNIYDIIMHPLVEQFIKNYDGYGRHMVELVDGYKFDFDPTIDIGNVKELCESINNHIVKK